MVAINKCITLRCKVCCFLSQKAVEFGAPDETEVGSREASMREGAGQPPLSPRKTVLSIEYSRLFFKSTGREYLFCKHVERSRDSKDLARLRYLGVLRIKSKFETMSVSVSFSLKGNDQGLGRYSLMPEKLAHRQCISKPPAG